VTVQNTPADLIRSARHVRWSLWQWSQKRWQMQCWTTSLAVAPERAGWETWDDFASPSSAIASALANGRDGDLMLVQPMNGPHYMIELVGQLPTRARAVHEAKAVPA
jgi:hypothetical protein